MPQHSKEEQRVEGPPAVSVVIPCYNTAHYLGEAMASVLAQSWSDLELLVIDDGSVDATGEVAAAFALDPRVRYHRQENRGLSDARNRGIELSRGQLIAFLDADDVWESEKLASQLALLRSFPECGLVFSDYSTFDAQGVLAAGKNSRLYELHRPDFETLFSRSNFIYPSTVVVRKKVLDQTGGFDTSLRSAEDYDMWLRIAKVAQLAGVPDSLVRIRQHGDNMSLNVRRMLENELAVVRKNATGSRSQLRRRSAKIYYLNADRSLHAGKRLASLKLLLAGLALCPWLYIDVCVVLIKLVLGGERAQRLRRQLNHRDSPLARLYWSIYSRY